MLAASRLRSAGLSEALGHGRRVARGAEARTFRLAGVSTAAKVTLGVIAGLIVGGLALVAVIAVIALPAEGRAGNPAGKTMRSTVRTVRTVLRNAQGAGRQRAGHDEAPLVKPGKGGRERAEVEPGSPVQPRI
jgi:hypothetical protein